MVCPGAVGYSDPPCAAPPSPRRPDRRRRLRCRSSSACGPHSARAAAGASARSSSSSRTPGWARSPRSCASTRPPASSAPTPTTVACSPRRARLLAGFERRSDLAQHRAALADTGIAGTAIHYRFYAPTARWLGNRWPDRLTIDWDEVDRGDRLEALLPLLALPAETPGLDEVDLGLRGWIRRLAGPRTTDAAFVVRRFAELPLDDQARDLIYDQLDLPLRLAPGADTPARTREALPARSPWFPRRTLGGRPDLAREARRRPRAVRALTPREGARWIDRARAAMVTRSRDLDVFAYGSPDDVRVVEWDEGLQFVVIGAIPERRLLLEGVYGWLTLRNGVPTGYVLVERAVPVERDRLQRLRDLSRRRRGAGLRARARDDARAVRRRHVHDLSLPARRRQRRGTGLGRLVVLRQARLPAARRRHTAPRRRRAPARGPRSATPLEPRDAQAAGAIEPVLRPRAAPRRRDGRGATAQRRARGDGSRSRSASARRAREAAGRARAEAARLLGAITRRVVPRRADRVGALGAAGADPPRRRAVDAGGAARTGRGDAGEGRPPRVGLRRALRRHARLRRAIRTLAERGEAG